MDSRIISRVVFLYILSGGNIQFYRIIMKKNICAFAILCFFFLFPKRVAGVTLESSPFYPEVDRIENENTCIHVRDVYGSIEITNTCDNQYYIREKSGTFSYLRNNDERYSDGITLYYTREPAFSLDECKIREVRMVDDVNVCDMSAIEQAGDGTVVKYWSVPVYKRSDYQPVIIHGKTYYKEITSITDHMKTFSVITYLLILASVTFVFAALIARCIQIRSLPYTLLFTVLSLLCGLSGLFILSMTAW